MDMDGVTQSPVPLGFDDRPVPRRIGLVLLATDHTTERDFARICRPDEAGVYANRIAYENPTTPENLHRMQPRLPQTRRYHREGFRWMHGIDLV